MSDSDDYSDESSEDTMPSTQHHHHRHHQYQQASHLRGGLAASASNVGQRLASPPPQKPQEFAFTPRKIQSKPINGPLLSATSVLNPVIEPAPNKLQNCEESFVTYSGAVNIDFAELLAQPDGGLELELSKGHGLNATPEYSNSLHATPEVRAFGAVDVLHGKGYVKQTNNLGIPLHISLPGIPMSSAASLDGSLSFYVASGATCNYDRTLTQASLELLENFPGQKAEDQKNFVYDSGTNPQFKHVTMDPPPLASYFYERLPEVQADPKLSLFKMQRDALGSVYAPRDLMNKALEATKEVDEKIVYTDLSPEKMRIKIALMPEKKLTAAGEVLVRQKLGHAFKTLPAFNDYVKMRSQALTASASLGSAPTKRVLEKKEAPAAGVNSALASLASHEREFVQMEGAQFRLTYEIKLPYLKAYPTFKYAE